MSESSCDFVDGSEDLGQNDTSCCIRSEKLTSNQSEANHNSDQSIDLVLNKHKFCKDNLEINFLTLKPKDVNCSNNEHMLINGKQYGYNSVNMTEPIGDSINNINVEFQDLKELNVSEVCSDSSAKSLCRAETEDIAMRAALSKLTEQFGFGSSEGEADCSQTFYAVYIPNDCGSKPTDGKILHVYREKAEALKVMKQSKKARLKQFKSEKEAVTFATHGSEMCFQQNTESVSSGEKTMPFKCPRVQDMISFKKAIENGDLEEVKKKISDNPRYLVSSGDTPAILQEGSRYNALHIAAKSKNSDIVRLILDCITNLEFISYLYDDSDMDSCRQRMEVLLDLYLNMPDKGLNETPLHIAVKHGAIDVVEHLVSYPQCQKNLINKFQQQPKDIICSRVNGPCEKSKEAISALLEEQYYIPVLRYEDNTIQPRVGTAFSPSKPLKLSEEFLSPRIEIQAYAGPMTKESAELFKKKWKYSPRSATTPTQSSSLKLVDVEKGLERIGRNLALELKVPWKEYWPFLDTFVDLSSEEGLKMLENYLKMRFEESLQQVNNGGGTYIVESGEKLVSPITALCEAMRYCSLNDDSGTPAKKIKWSVGNNKCDSYKRINENLENETKNPLLYVERSCQVFGKRVASALSSLDLYGTNTECIKDSLEIQIKHLLTNILSYKEDSRFQSINFQLIHSRVAAIAVHSLEDFTDRDKDIVLNSLKDIDWSNGTLSDDEDLNYNYRTINHDIIGNSVKQHLRCLIKHLINELNSLNLECDPSDVIARNEADCTRLWSSAWPCYCTWNQNNLCRPRIGVKRKSSKFLRNNLVCDNHSAYRRILTDEESEKTSCEIDTYLADKEEELEAHNDEGDETDDNEHVCLGDDGCQCNEENEVFATPPSGLSDSEEETMEDPMTLPDTFIFQGSTPSKSDYAVLDAIESMDISSIKYPNIYRWKHLVNLYNASNNSSACDRRHSASNNIHKKINPSISTPTSSPGKILNKSIGSCDISSRSGNVEPWERILGPYSPRASRNSYLSLYSQETSSKR